MIEEVIASDGKVYKIVYPKNPIVTLLDEEGKFHEQLHLETVLSTYRPYRIDGDISNNLKPWEYYGGPAKEVWMKVAEHLQQNGYEVSHNRQDMIVTRDGLFDRIPCEVVMNHTPEAILRVENEMYKMRTKDL